MPAYMRICAYRAFLRHSPRNINSYVHLRIYAYAAMCIYTYNLRAPPPAPAAKISLARVRFFIAKEGAFIVIYLCKVRTDGPLYHGE